MSLQVSSEIVVGETSSMAGQIFESQNLRTIWIFSITSGVFIGSSDFRKFLMIQSLFLGRKLAKENFDPSFRLIK